MWQQEGRKKDDRGDDPGVELRPFNDRALNRDLIVLCERVNQASPRLPDGRLLMFTIRPSCCILAEQRVGKIPWLPVNRRKDRLKYKK